MTHLNDAIRTDALALLEIFLDHTPAGSLRRYYGQVRPARARSPPCVGSERPGRIDGSNEAAEGSARRPIASGV